MSDNLFGHWAGAAVNDTSQVTATAFSYSVEAGETATIVKLTRNTLMVPVIFTVGMWFAARESRHAAADERRSWLSSARKAVPTFLLGFLALALINAGLVLLTLLFVLPLFFNLPNAALSAIVATAAATESQAKRVREERS